MARWFFLGLLGLAIGDTAEVALSASAVSSNRKGVVYIVTPDPPLYMNHL